MKGSVTKMLQKMRALDTPELLDRFKHLAGAQAIRAYIVAKPIPELDIEVRLTKEELSSRMRVESSHIAKMLPPPIEYSEFSRLPKRK